jgi:DNA-binding response OmpR family regulator
MRILIVEDEKDVADFVKKVMEEESHAVDTVYDGKNGEDFALSESYDLVILDILLPKKNGLAVLKSLREEGLTTPVLMLTARKEISDRVTGLDSGADDYLTKPFAVAELRARVRALLRRHSPEKSPLLKAGRLTFNTVSHQAFLGEEPLELTKRELAILEYLLRNKNRLLTKAMIAEHVWDFHFSSDYNLIEVYIRRIRKEIERLSSECIIQTVRNGGYVVREPEE